MALKARKTEHAGHKGAARKSGHYGTRAEAKVGSRKRRRVADAEAENMWAFMARLAPIIERELP